MDLNVQHVSFLMGSLYVNLFHLFECVLHSILHWLLCLYRLLTTDEYISYMKSEYDKIINARVVPVSASTSVVSSTSLLSSPSASSTTTAAASETAVVPFVPAPEITVEDVTGFVQQVVFCC